jgi:hypothetical protein
MGYRTIFVDETAGTAVAPAASTLPQACKSWTLNVTDDEYITVTAKFSVVTISATGVVFQAGGLPLQIAIGANVYTAFVSPLQGAATNLQSRNLYTVTFTAVSRAGDTCTAGLGGGLTADSATIVNVIGWKINAESGTQAGT